MENEGIDLKMSELVDLALSPESPHVVNFGALRSCLLAMLDNGDKKNITVSSNILKGQECRLERVNELWSRLEITEKAVEELKGNSNETEDLLKRAGFGQKPNVSEFAISDIWKTIEIDHRVAANSNGIEKLGIIMDGISKVMKETDRRQKELDKFIEDIQNSVRDLREEVEHQTRELNDTISNLSDNYIDKSLLKAYVTWNQLEEALKGVMARIPSVEAVCQTDQSISKMRSRSVSNCSLGPSEELTELLSKIGSLASDHIEFIKKMETLEESLQEKANSNELENYMLADEINGKFDSLTSKTSQVETNLENIAANVKEVAETTKTTAKDVLDLTDKFTEIVDRVGCCEGSIKDLQSLCVILDNTKADRCAMDIALAEKADKALFEDLLSLDVFKETIKGIEEAILGVNTRLDDQEANNQLREAMRLLAEEVDTKLSNSEFSRFKNFIDKKIRELRKMSSTLGTQPSPDEAAIINKRLPTSFHCLSCGRPVNVVVHRYLNDSASVRTSSAVAEFPEMHANSSHRTVIRPYSSLRAKSKDRRLNERYNMWESDHSCLQQKKMPPVIYSSLSATERPIMGKDGHIYKGRINEDIPEESIKYRVPLISQGRLTPSDVEDHTHVINDQIIYQEFHQETDITNSEHKNGNTQSELNINK